MNAEIREMKRDLEMLNGKIEEWFELKDEAVRLGYDDTAERLDDEINDMDLQAEHIENSIESAKEQAEYEGLGAWEYNGIKQSDFL